MSPWFFNVYMDAVMKKVKMGRRREGILLRMEIAWPLYADYLVLYGESEEDLRAMVGRFVQVGRRRGLKVNAGKSKVMELGRGLECEVCIDGICLEYVSENLNTVQAH